LGVSTYLGLNMYGLDSIRRFQAGGEAFSDDVVRDYIRSLADSSGNIRESDIAAAMSTFGVSPAQVARATGADPGYVSQQYSNYLAEPPPPPPPTPAAVDPVAQQYANDFNALINQGNYEDAARVVKEAELAGYGDEAYRAAAVALGAKANLPGGSDFIQPEGIQSIRDYVANVTNVDEFNKLIRDEEFGKAAAFAQSQGFTPDQVATYINENAANLGFSEGFGVTGENIATLYPGYVAPPPPAVVPPSVDTGSGTGLGASEEFTNAVRGGYFVSAAQIAQNLGYNAQQAAEYINANAAALGLPENFAGVTGENLQPFFDGVNEKRIDAGMDDPLKDPGTDFVQGVVTDEAGNILSGPPDKVISGIPKFARQTQSNVPFAPLRRGLAQLRPAMYMPGLTSGQAPLGGSGFTPEALRTANQGLSPADRAYLMDVGGVSPAEASAAIGTPVGQLQAEYNQLRPGGLFSTGVPAPRGLPEDFALQTGAYGAPTPTFLALPEKKTATSAAETPLPSGSTQNTDTGSEYIATDREGGLIKMAEGGGPPKMTELSAKKAGSTFDISKYIDDQGRLVGGYSKPIYDDNRVITGYDYRPYERDVVFGKELREKEAAMRLTDAEREQMMIEMAMRQGRTGILPTTGGLAGIEIGDPMMRRRPQYYSTVEQFRPRYAEGGLANVAQNLAERGRKGDSMLVHMAPEEVAGLRALARAQGTDMTINPRTGLPEAFSLRKLFKAASFILPFIPIPGLFGMSSLLTKSILSGVAAGASAKGGFDFKQALGGGLRAYALGSLGEKMGGAPTPDGAPTAPTTTVGEAAGGVNPMAGIENIEVPLSGQPALGPSAPTGVNPMAGIENIEVPLSGQPALGPSVPIDTYTLRGGPQTGEASYNKYPSDAVTTTPGSVPEGGAVPGRMANVITEGKGFGPAPLTKGTEIAMAGLGGFSLEKAAEEQRKYDMEATAIRQEDEERKRRFDELFARTLGSVRTAKAGGTINLAKGGMTYMEAGGTTGPTGEPRMVQGTGDGMSDSVPATIEGIQEARLANDEFVIPADVVADIGNGSSNAGAKKLYNAMDRIRKARHGTTKQPPEIRAERLMPA
jgi:hypothetical protein